MRTNHFKYIITSTFFIGLSGIAHSQEVINSNTENDQQSLSRLFEEDARNHLTESFENPSFITGDITETIVPLTIDEHKAIIVSSLKNKLNNTALRHIEEIAHEPNEYIFNQYTKALAYSNQGLFKNSYQTLNEVSLEKGSFQEPAQHFADKLKLILAEQDINEEYFSAANQFITQYSGFSGDRDEQEHLKRLKKTLRDRSFNNDPLFEQASSTPLKIALLLPLTGKYKQLGEQLLAAAQLSLFNNPNPNILLYPHDTGSTEQGAIQAIQKAISDRAHVVLGPLTADNTTAISRYTIQAGMPIISLSSDLNIIRRGTSTLGYNPTEQAEEMARYAADNDIKRVAILTPNTAYGTIMAESFKKTIHKLGIELVDEVIFDNNSPDQTIELERLAQITKSGELLKEELKALEREYALVGDAMEDIDLKRLEELKTAKPEPLVEFDALYLPATADKLPLIASQLAYYNMDASDVMLLGTAQWQNRSIHKNRAEYIRGAFFPAPPHQNIGKTYNHYKSTYDKTAHPLTIMAYDGITLLSQLYEENNNNPEFLTDLLYKKEGFDLNGGRLKFNKQGIPSRLYSIYEVRSSASVEREAAPKQFPPVMPDNIDVRDRRGFGFFSPWSF